MRKVGNSAIDILIVTDIRFWQRLWGNYERVFALVKHCLRRGYRVGVHLVSGVEIPSEEDRLGMLSAMCSPPAMDVNSLSERLVFSSSGSRPALLAYARIRSEFHGLRNRLFRVSPRNSHGTWEAVLAEVARPEGVFSPRHVLNAISLKKVVQQESPAVVIVEYIHYAYLIPCARNVRYPPRCVALDTIDVQSKRAQSFKKRKIKHWLEIDEATELRVADTADVVLAIQSEDAKFFRQGLKHAVTLTVPHGYEVRKHHPSDSQRVLFVGGKIDPNRLGILEFIEKGWSKVRHMLGSSAVLRIAGHVCDRLGSLSSPGVEMLGYVPNLYEEYESAAVVIAPIYFGGGLQIKVVEALCSGKALVCAPCAAFALQEGAGSAFSLVDSPERMAEEIVRLLTNDAARHAMEIEALNFAKAHFSEDACYAGLDAVIDKAVKGFREK